MQVTKIVPRQPGITEYKYMATVVPNKTASHCQKGNASLKVLGLTYTAAVEHEISGLAVSEAEEDGDCAGEDGEGHGVVHLNGGLCEDGVVGCGDP